MYTRLRISPISSETKNSLSASAARAYCSINTM